MSEGSRLSRWSQRKLAARHGGAVPEVAEDVVAKTHPGDRPQPSARESNEPLAETPAVQAPVSDEGADVATAEELAELPSIESLTAQSDYTGFLKKNVPEALRKAALRKLWVSDPILANLDGLNDYDEDFTIVTAMTMDDTSYKIGRGFLDEVKPEPAPELEPNSELEPKLAQANDAPADGETETETEIEAGSADESQSGDDAQAELASGTEADDEMGDSDAPPAKVPGASRQVGGADPDRESETDAPDVKLVEIRGP